jgi:hypothetical protein
MHIYIHMDIEDPNKYLISILLAPYQYTVYTGWWLSHPSEKYEFVSWDHYSQYMENKNVPNHQPVIYI